jgi:hypothetical protein
MQALDFFDKYAAAGLHVIPLYKNSKMPIGKGWNETWDLARSRNLTAQHPDCNLGLLLGDVLDVEGDSTIANQRLAHLIGDVPHPCYCSARSVHHLFLNPDPKLTSIRCKDIEFRAHRHQSVLPPSSHKDGPSYSWLRGSVFPIPEMPKALLDFYVSIVASKKAPATKPGHTHPWCSVCEKRVFLHRKRYELEVRAFADLGRTWTCRACRAVDLRPACRKLKKVLS